MKNLYDIRNKNGVHLCYQVAKNERQAIESAKMYGHRGAKSAEFVRED